MILSHCRRAIACVGLLFLSHATSQQLVRIDDTNVYSPTNPNGIQFSSKGWSTNDPSSSDPHYNNTYTWSQVADSNLVFFFQGTVLSHYADNGPNRGPVGVSIDGRLYENATWTNVGNVRYQQEMWQSIDLSPGDHQVVVSNVGTGDPTTSMMGLDYFLITPGADGNIIPTTSGPGASVIPLNAVLVDDSSDMISYSESWSVYNSYKHRGIYLGGTQHSSSTPGGSAVFKFNGTAVWYFSDQYESNALVSISVDGGAPDLVNTASTGTLWLSQILVWSKTGLTDGPHTVNITHAGTDTMYANVDFFKYMPSSASSSPPAAGNASSNTKPAPIGAIVGGVVGGVALIGFIAGMLIWRWRRQPNQDETTPAHETYVGNAAYGGKEKYAPAGPPYTQSPPGTPGFVPTLSYQNGIYAPTQTQNEGGRHSITPTTWTGATYAGHPEIHH